MNLLLTIEKNILPNNWNILNYLRRHLKIITSIIGKKLQKYNKKIYIL